MEEQIDLNEEEIKIVQEDTQRYIKSGMPVENLAYKLAHTEMMLEKFKKGKERFAFAFFLVFIPFLFIVAYLVGG